MQLIGLPEARINLAQATIHLALAPEVQRRRSRRSTPRSPTSGAGRGRRRARRPARRALPGRAEARARRGLPLPARRPARRGRAAVRAGRPGRARLLPAEPARRRAGVAERLARLRESCAASPRVDRPPTSDPTSRVGARRSGHPGVCRHRASTGRPGSSSARCRGECPCRWADRRRSSPRGVRAARAAAGRARCSSSGARWTRPRSPSGRPTRDRPRCSPTPRSRSTSQHPARAGRRHHRQRRTVTTNAPALTSLFTATLGGPLIKVAAFSYGVRKAGRRELKNAAPLEAVQRRQAECRRMRRLFWLASGVTVGVSVVPQGVRRPRSRLTPRGHRREPRRGRCASSAQALGEFGAEVRAGMAERERAYALVEDTTGVPVRAATSPRDARRGAGDRQASGTRSAYARLEADVHCRRRPRRSATSRTDVQTPEIRRRFLAHFEDARPHRRAQRLADPRRPDAAVRQRRHGAVQAVLPRRAAAALAARHQRAEVRAHPRHRGGRQDHPARHVLPDGRQLLLRRLLQGRRDPARLGAAHRSPSTTAATASTPSGSGSPSTTTTTRPSTLAARSSACRRSASSAAAGATTTGTWASPAPAVRAGRSTSTAARSTAARAARSSTRTATSRSGTSSSCSTSRGELRPKDDFDIRRRAAAEEHRHRHGRRADGHAAAGRRQPLRDRPDPPDPRPRRASSPAAAPTARDAPRTTSGCRVIADHVRTGADAHRRRRHAGQRGPRLRAAPHAAPRRARGRGCSASTRAGAAELLPSSSRDAHGPVLPGARHRLRAGSPPSPCARGGGVPRHAAPRARRSSTPAVRRRRRRPAAPRCPATSAFAAARHLRLPDRPHARDGRASRARRSTRRASAR